LDFFFTLDRGEKRDYGGKRERRRRERESAVAAPLSLSLSLSLVGTRDVFFSKTFL